LNTMELQKTLKKRRGLQIKIYVVTFKVTSCRTT
jgi:hypothetical protein